jgi:Rod binding domain-containing protein
LELEPITSLSQLDVGALTNPAELARLKSIADPRERAEGLARQLESLFFSMVLKAMRNTVPKSGLWGEGLGNDIYVAMLDEQYAALANMPRDRRLHETLVRQIVQAPQRTEDAIAKLDPGAPRSVTDSK